jgi:hypothetical protein
MLLDDEYEGTLRLEKDALVQRVAHVLSLFTNTTGLHKEHLEAFVLGHPESTAQPEEAFEHRLIEEELSLQLSLLNEQLQNHKTLFPKETPEEEAVEETIGVLHAKDVIPAPPDEILVNEGKAMMMLDEETMEAAVICLVIGGLALGLLNI